jgi:hypothetical protein
MRAYCRHEAAQKLLAADDQLVQDGLQPLLDSDVVKAVSFVVNDASRSLLARLGVDPEKRLALQLVSGGPSVVLIAGRTAWFVTEGRDTIAAVFGARLRCS